MRERTRRCGPRGLVSALALVLGLLMPAVPARAASFVVTTTTDAAHATPLDGTCTSTLAGGTCTLRAAIQAANFLTGGPHVIQLQAAGTYLLDTANLGALPEIDNVTLGIGNTSGGAIAVDGNHAVRVFDVGPGTAAQVGITGVTIQNGIAVNRPGGGVRVGSRSTLTLTNSTLAGNSAFDGGGIYNDGNLTVTDSTLVGNSASSSGGSGGGGIFIQFGTVTVTNSTLASNSAPSGSGGGILNLGGTVTVTNSTLVGNSAGNSGGGISNRSFGTMTLTNSTLAGNSAPAGTGGIFINIGALTLQSTILAQSPSGGNCAGTFTSQGDNLSDDATCPLGAGDYPNVNPLLGTLGNYGGSTQTIPLLQGSPALDAVTHTLCPPPTTDQRGVVRPQGIFCDVGAFEGFVTLTPTPTSTPTVTPTPTRTSTPTNTPTSTSTPTSTNTPTSTPTPTRTPTPTATPTSPSTPAPTPTSTPTPTATPSACAPRPPLGLLAVPNGDGRLRVTLTATANAGASNELGQVLFTFATNALVDDSTQTGRQAPFLVNYPAGTQQTTFFVRRATPGQAATVELIVVDDCGRWPTFVGGGPTAF